MGRDPLLHCPYRLGKDRNVKLKNIETPLACIEMPYISRIYKDSENTLDSESESVKKACIQEMKTGHVPVLIFWKKRNIKIFVSRDVSIQDILTSVYQMTNLPTDTLHKASVYIYNKPSGDYSNGKVVLEYDKPIATFSTETDIQVRLFLFEWA